MSARLRRPRSASIYLVYLILPLAAIWAYSPVRGFAFLNFDDPAYVNVNPPLLSFYDGNWFPVTLLSHRFDARVSGLSPAWPHVHNLLLHAANAVLLFYLLLRLTRAQWRSAFAAALFALHPLHVESVAWISERKDVLSVFFGLLALLAYVRYTERASKARGFLVAAAFCLSLMAKAMLVTLPVVFLLLDFWPLRRKLTRGLLLEKLPLFAISAVAAIVALLAQQSGASIASLDAAPVTLRLGNVLVSYATYLAQFFWPADLAVFYPYPPGIPAWEFAGAALLLAAISWLAIRSAPSRSYLTVGWFWFLITLLPVVGIVQVGAQSHADRYMYFPLIGLAIALAWGAAELAANLPKPLLAAAAGAVCVACMLLTSTQVTYWRNSQALFQHALDVTRDNFLAYSGLAQAGLADNRLDDARAQAAEAVRIRPAFAPGHANLAAALARLGRTAEAEPEYREAVRLDPGNPDAQAGLGAILAGQGRPAEALPHLQEALRLRPADADIHLDLGALYASTGKSDAAIGEFAEAVRVTPNDFQAHFALGNALARADHLPRAIEEFQFAVRLNPASAPAHFSLGGALWMTGERDAAIQHLREAVRLQPDFTAARQALDQILAEK